MLKSLRILVAVLLSLLILPAAAQAGDANYWLQTDLHIRNTGDDACSYVRIETPLPVTQALYGRVLSEEFSLEPTEIIVDENGERTGVFTIDTLPPGAEVVFTQRYLITQEPSTLNTKYEPTANPKVPHTDERIKTLAQELAFGVSSPEEIVPRLARFTHEHIRYSRDSMWRNKGAISALENREGVCEDYAALFVALARAMGVESRLVYGYMRGDPTHPFQRHAWAEFLAPDIGWVPVDPTVKGTEGILDYPAAYIAQWYKDEPVRLRYLGGRISAGRVESVMAEATH